MISPVDLVHALSTLVREPSHVHMSSDYGALLETAFTDRNKTLQWGSPTKIFGTTVTFTRIDGERFLIISPPPK